MDPELFLFFYYRQLSRNAQERERLESEHTPDHSGIFTLPHSEPVAEAPSAVVRRFPSVPRS